MRYLALLLLAVTAHAATPKPPTLTFTPIAITITAPSQNTNNTALTDLTGYRLYHRLAPATSYDAMPFQLGLVSRYDYPAPFVNGTHYYALAAVNSTNVESAKTPEVSISHDTMRVEVIASNVTTAPTIYTVIKGADNLILIPVGAVPLGTACDTSQGVLRAGKLYNVVDITSVTWSGTARPVVALGSCD